MLSDRPAATSAAASASDPERPAATGARRAGERLYYIFYKTTENALGDRPYGIKEGDVVVTSGQFLIDSEASVRASFSRMQPVEK